MIVVRMPPNVGNDHTLQFLGQTAFMFSHMNRRTRDVTIRYDRVTKISLFGQLLLYKFVSFSAEHNCFGAPQLGLSEYVKRELEKSGFDDLISFYLEGSKKSWFGSKKVPKSLRTSVDQDFFIAPLQLLRGEKEQVRLERDFLEKLKLFYGHDQQIISLLSTCVTEVYMNFWEHATSDSGSVVVAKGDTSHFEILFADTGDGIVSSLRSSGIIDSKDLLRSAIQCGVTSKPDSNHMGWGLWLVSELCRINNGELEMFSEGRMLAIHNGRLVTGKCGYWRGTILRLTMPLAAPKTVCSLDLPSGRRGLKINWIEAE